jgi:hypothetical protein
LERGPESRSVCTHVLKKGVRGLGPTADKVHRESVCSSELNALAAIVEAILDLLANVIVHLLDRFVPRICLLRRDDVKEERLIGRAGKSAVV